MVSVPSGFSQVHDRLRVMNRQLSVLNHVVGNRLKLRDIDMDCLDLIARHGPIGPSELARRTAVHPATMTGILDRLQRAGCREVKLYQSFPPALVRPMAAEAHRRGLRVVGRGLADGNVEVRDRRTGEHRSVPADAAATELSATVRAALEAAGVEFIPENGGGVGVRLRK